jgi:hypothetical protein
MTDIELHSNGNRCKADHARRERAMQGSELISREGTMERRIGFEVGYDHTEFPEECGGGGHGRHGMTMAFILIGPSGAVQWKINMLNWYPGNVAHLDIPATEPISAVPANPRLGDTMAIDLGYHSPKPRWEGQEEYGHMECHLLPEGSCFYDGSGLNAVPILEAFLSHGPMAVWAALARYYSAVFGDAED